MLFAFFVANFRLCFKILDYKFKKELISIFFVLIQKHFNRIKTIFDLVNFKNVVYG